MLRQTPASPAVRLRAQTGRMGRRNAAIQSGAASVMVPVLRQEIFTKLKSGKWRKKINLRGTANFEECVDAALTHLIEPAFDNYAQKIFESNDASMKALEKIIDDIPEDPSRKDSMRRRRPTSSK